MAAGVHVVWLKRDLRTRDHAPLARAMQQAAADGHRVVVLHVFEPGLLDHATTSSRHVQFQWQCLEDMAGTFGQEAWPVSFVRLHAPMLDVLDRLHAQTPIQSLHSHEETGVAWTFDRDKAVADWCTRVACRGSKNLNSACSVDAPTDGGG